MTGMPARFARLRSSAVARAASRACGRSRSPPSNSRSLIQSMSSSATRHLSGAAPCRSLPLERGMEGGCERGVAADERLPCQLDSFAPSFGNELHAGGADRQHVRLAVDLHLAPERFFELRCHSCLNNWMSAGS